MIKIPPNWDPPEAITWGELLVAVQEICHTAGPESKIKNSTRLPKVVRELIKLNRAERNT